MSANHSADTEPAVNTRQATMMQVAILIADSFERGSRGEVARRRCQLSTVELVHVIQPVYGILVQGTSDRKEQRMLVERLAQLRRDSGTPEALARRGRVEGRDEDDRERRVVRRQPLLEVEARHSLQGDVALQGDVEDQARRPGERR